jgi:hypothetical protein
VIGHEPMGPRAEEKVDRTFVLEPGPRSQEISLFTLTYSETSVTRANLQVYRLSSLPAGDPTLDAMTKAFQAKHGLGKSTASRWRCRPNAGVHQSH